MLVLGGGTPGGLRGRWPGLAGEALEGPGDLPVVTDYREVLGEVLSRHVPHAPLDRVFPSRS